VTTGARNVGLPSTFMGSPGFSSDYHIHHPRPARLRHTPLDVGNEKNAIAAILSNGRGSLVGWRASDPTSKTCRKGMV